MRGRILFGLLFVLVLGWLQPVLAEEIAGKVVRVDVGTVTVAGLGDQRVILTVEQAERQKAASFLGKTVKLTILSRDGANLATNIRPCTNKSP